MDYCLSCFGRSKHKDGEREPLLPKHSHRHDSSRDLSQPVSSTVVDAERPLVDKVVDVLAALNAGKLPTQDQLSNFLQMLLKSELLRNVEDKGKVLPGYGPLSTQGRKVLADVRALLQAILQFGVEKNADNKLQELYFQVVQMDMLPLEFNLDNHSTYQAGHVALNKTMEGTSELAKESPSKDEAAFDTQLFFYAIRTLIQTCLSSSSFRLILFDLITIAREQFGDTAANIEHAAHQVEETAAQLEHKARQGNDIMGEDLAVGGRSELDASVSVDDVKRTGQQVVDHIKIAGESAKREWDAAGEEVKGKAKQKTLERLQQLITRIQSDRASRSALRAILFLVRKYSAKVSSASEVMSSTIEKTIAQTQDVLTDESSTENKKPFIDITADALLEDLKTVLERVAQGRSLDGMLLAFSRVVRDLNEVPSIIHAEVNERMEEKARESSPELTPEPEPSPGLPPPTPTSSAPQLSKSQKKKQKKKQRAALAKARELEAASTPSPVSPSTSKAPEAISRSESQQSESQADDEAPVTAEPETIPEPSATSTDNPFRTYFSCLGEYLDKSLQPDWVTSGEGKKTLEGLFDEGLELSQVAGISVVNVAKDIAETSSSEPTTPAGGEIKTVTQQRKEWEAEVRRKFKADLTTLMNELEAFVAALENDKTTMALIRSFDALGSDLTDLIRQEAEMRIGAATSWASWLGWVVPRVLSMIPSSALPIPSLEAKTRTTEAALRPLYSPGVGRTSKLTTSLIPDEVVLKEWTEMRIDMADHAPEAQTTYDNVQNPDVKTTSRVRMHVDGIRARLEGMGYYFKYTAGLVGYEDEGVVGVDVGIDDVYQGLEVDFEVEVENRNGESKKPKKVNVPTVPVPEIIVEDAETGLASQSGVKGESNAEVMRVDMNGEVMGETARADPLFHVVDVTAAMHGLHFQIDQSKHWIINKLLVQPLAGPIVGRLVKMALEDKMKVLLESLAQGLGEVSANARKRGDERRTRAAERAVQERIGGGPDVQPTTAEVEAEMLLVKEEESFAHVLSDWWGAVLHTGPSVLGRTGKDLAGGEEEVRTRTSVQATTKGIIYSSTSLSSPSSSRSSSRNGLVQDQPEATPEMVYHPETKSFEQVERDQEQRVDEGRDKANDIIVAVGGAQLFPGRAGAAEQGVMEGFKSNLQGAAESFGEDLREDADLIERAGGRFEERLREERSTTKNGPSQIKVPGTWESNAFDF